MPQPQQSTIVDCFAMTIDCQEGPTTWPSTEIPLHSQITESDVVRVIFPPRAAAEKEASAPDRWTRWRSCLRAGFGIQGQFLSAIP